MKNICQFERRDVISQNCSTSTSLHLGGAEISPRQASCTANGLTSEPGGEDCRGVICKADGAGLSAILTENAKFQKKTMSNFYYVYILVDEAPGTHLPHRGFVTETHIDFPLEISGN